MANEFRKVIDTNNLVHPVCDDNRVDWSSYAKTGVHNLFPISSALVSRTGAGVAFTVNRNSAGQVTSINAVRTSANNDDAYLQLDSAFEVTVPMIFNGCPSNGGNGKYAIVLYNGSSFFVDEGNGVLLPVGTYSINIRYYSAYSDSVTFYPMARLESDTDPTFAPPAMTNQQLTEQVTPVVLGSNDDLNNITKMGLYIVAGLPANTPDNKGFYALLVYPVAADGMSVIQIALHGENAIYYRRRSGSPISWKAWVKVEGSIVS